MGSCGIANTYPDIGTVYLVCPPVRFIQNDKTVETFVPSSIPPIPISKHPCLYILISWISMHLTIIAPEVCSTVLVRCACLSPSCHDLQQLSVPSCGQLSSAARLLSLHTQLLAAADTFPTPDQNITQNHPHSLQLSWDQCNHFPLCNVEFQACEVFCTLKFAILKEGTHYSA